MNGVLLYERRTVMPACDCDWIEWRVAVGIGSAVSRAITSRASRLTVKPCCRTCGVLKGTPRGFSGGRRVR